MYRVNPIYYSILVYFVSSYLLADTYDNYTGAPITLNVGTEIDKSDMYNFDLLNFKIYPESITLHYDPHLKTFATRKFDLHIDTNIPKSETEETGFGYQLVLEENLSSCYENSLNALEINRAEGYEKIATIYLDEESGDATDSTGIFDIGVPKTVSEFNNVDETKGSIHKLLLAFAQIPKENSLKNITFCQGAFTISFRLNI